MPTATFGVLYVFFVLSLERRRVLHVNVTAHPYAAWAAQQMIEAVAPDVVAERVIRDRNRIFGAVFEPTISQNARPKEASGFHVSCAECATRSSVSGSSRRRARAFSIGLFAHATRARTSAGRRPSTVSTSRSGIAGKLSGRARANLQS